MSRSRIEQESTITFNAEEADALIFSANPSTHTKMKNMGWEPYRVEGGGACKYYRIPKKALTIRSKEAVLAPKRGKNAGSFKPKP